MSLSYKDVAEILKIVDASACEEVVLEVEGLRLVVRKGARGGPAATIDTSSLAPGPQARAISSGLEARQQHRETGGTREPAQTGKVAVRAPMIGTFYRRPSPQDKPFVEIGQRVAKGDPLCLLEVMKLYTTIAAPEAGVVTEIPVADGALVEFDQVLVLIEPD
jgi:acetyl-CoA carboxylase biotin carboxyl carrier protein